MINKFFKLDFGLQMLIAAFTLFFSNQILTYTLSIANKPNTIWFNGGFILSVVFFLILVFSMLLGIISIIKFFKNPKKQDKNHD